MIFGLMVVAVAAGCAKLPDGKVDVPAPSPVTFDPSQIKSFPVTDEDKRLAGYWELQPTSSTENRTSVLRRLKFSIVDVSPAGTVTIVDSCLLIRDEASGSAQEVVSVAWYTLFDHKIVMGRNMLTMKEDEAPGAKKPSKQKQDPAITELTEQTLVLNGKDRYRRFVPNRELKAGKPGEQSLCDYKIPEQRNK